MDAAGVAVSLGVGSFLGGAVGEGFGCGVDPALAKEFACSSRFMKGRSLPSCPGNWLSSVAAFSAAAIEFSLASNVFSFGASADLRSGSTVVVGAFFGTSGGGVGSGKSMIVSFGGGTSSGRVISG